LGTWFKFVSIMKHKEVSPFIGRTTGSIVAYWDVFDNSERAIATSIVRACADNVNDFGNHLDEVVGLDMVPELKDWADILTGKRSQRNFGERLAMLLDRLSSQNMAVSLASIRELRQMLIDNTTNFHAMALGDTFDPILTRLMSSLLSISTRDEDWQAIKTVGYECLGILGALDPDRFVPHPESVSITVMSNFTDHNESIEFALHLIRDVLVDAIRATNDTKLQGHLSFAIQELLSFCGFEEKILDESKNAKISKTTRDRWQSLPKDQLETLTPLLAARFSLPSIRGQSYTYPIYPTLPTYREWLQAWTSDLVNKLYSDKSVGAPADSQSIFGVFRGIFMRNQDVSIAHHILPHLVLSMLLSENPIIVADIQIEINAVLQDQVNIGSPNDKRSYSAQVIFDLMDHLSKWLRLQQTARSDRRSRIEVIEAVVTGIDTELMANAALQSKAFARSLRNFEQRILQLRALSRSDDELETYFERLHQIYAELDEPDGMEGVSNFVVTPALEHQIREHESTGRWTSAQSCWEVKLQQSPEDPSLHVGLLKCLKNLGHYDTLRNHIRGVLTRRPEWAEQISPFEAEAAWITGDWSTVRRVGGSSSPLAPVLLALHSKGNIDDVVDTARREIGSKIISREYGRSHDAVLQLHLLHEIHTICRSDHGLASKGASLNQVAVKRKSVESLIDDLSARLNSASPAFHVQEAILTIRRTAFGLVSANELKEEVGRGWIASSKIARKAGYLQTAYSAALQAQEANAQFAFIQQAKLTRVNQGAFKALTSLENSIKPILKASGSADRSVVGYALDRQLAKVCHSQQFMANHSGCTPRGQMGKRDGPLRDQRSFGSLSQGYQLGPAVRHLLMKKASLTSSTVSSLPIIISAISMTIWLRPPMKCKCLKQSIAEVSGRPSTITPARTTF
jgi:serine/threonine-protein kinase ATR